MSISQSPIGGMALFLAMAVFLGNNQHLQMIQILAESFELIPPTKLVLFPEQLCFISSI